MMIFQEVHNKTIEHFKNLGFASPRLEADYLLASAMKWERIDLYTKFEYPLNPEELDRCRDFVKRRSKKEPLAYITKNKAFFNSDFFVEPGVLIPRPDTELMVEKVLENNDNKKSYNILDLGAGSGCIGLSLLKELPSSQLTSVEKSDASLKVIQINAENLDVKDRVKILKHDLSNPLPPTELTSIDIIVCNPPYIEEGDQHVAEETKEFEPHEALYSKDNGMAAIKTWLPPILTQVKSGTQVYLEFGWQQKEKVKDFFCKQGFNDVSFFQDIEGRDRLAYIKKV